MDRIVKELGSMGQRITGFSLRKERALFEKLQPEDSKVCLDHLISYMHKSENQVELDSLGITNLSNQCHTVSRSLLVLYHFDKNHAGKISFEEFLDVLNYFRELDKRKRLEVSSSEKSSKSGSSDWFKKMLPPNWSSSSSVKPPEFPGSAALGLSDQEKTLHGHTVSSLTCKVLQRADSDGLSKSASVSSHNSECAIMQTMQVEVDTVTSASTVNDTEDEEARKMLLNDLTRKGGRKEFANWLFKVADVEHRNTFVTRAEIRALLNSIVDDGISPEALRVSLEVDDGMNREDVASASDTKSSHDSASDSSDSESEARLNEIEINRLLDAVMRQYDLSQCGRVAREDFMSLANMIEAEYESLNTDLGARRIGDYVLARILGSGSEGVVRLGVHRRLGTLHAVKIINKRGQQQSRLNREVAANLKLKHKCIVEVQEVIENADFMFIIMEYVNGGSLESYVSKKKPLDERVARKYAADLVDAFVTVHQQGVCHRDLRIENLLLDSKSELKIADFGHAGLFRAGYDIFSTMAVGSTSHMAPEQLEGANYSGEKLDVWSFAIILHFFLAGYNPFESNSTIQESLQNIRNANLSNLSPLLSPDARDLISKCLSRDFSERPSWEEISHHPWLLGDVMHIALMHRRAVFPLLEIGEQDARGSLPSIDAALSRLLGLTQTSLKDLGLATRVRDKGIDCAMMSKKQSKQLKFRLKFELVSKQDLQLMDDSDNSGGEFDDDVSLASSGSLSRTNSSNSVLARSKERDCSDSEAGSDLLPSRVGARLVPAAEEDDQQQWLVSAELLVGDPPQFDKVFRNLCEQCSRRGSPMKVLHSH